MIPTYPIIDLQKTGRNIYALCEANNTPVTMIQSYCNFSAPQAIYHWYSGRNLPSVDNLYALSILWGITMNDIIIEAKKGGKVTNE